MTFGGDGVGAKKTSPTDYSSMTQEQMSAVYAASKIPGYLIGK